MINEKNVPGDNKSPELQAFNKKYLLSKEFENKAELALQLKKIVSSLYEQDDLNNNFENHKKITEFITKLQKTYPNYQDYLLYHLISFSTPSKISTQFDFPGEDSIEKYLKSQAK